MLTIFFWITVLFYTCPADGVTCSCGRFIDNNANGVCDHSVNEIDKKEIQNSQLNSDKIAKSKKTDLSQIRKNSESSFQQKGIKKIDSEDQDSNNLQNINNTQKKHHCKHHLDNSKTSSNTITTASNGLKFRKFNYYLSEISITTIILFFISIILVKTKTIKRGTYKKIWNFILLLSFTISAITGGLLVIELNFGIRFIFPFDMLFWHVTTGIPALI
ncbi:hypothetical protein JXR93_10855, partial [bacterium]|nr:hypothetical protein [bacterium]